ncbi:hypothetical protein [Sphaerisporangium aureirubrum]|uniref:Uncharacterized protein n=1 Tax=Sphaerisporangium aureirubrum TaxID=1544736 RepID=A0ABW1NFI5_9ACTN
MDAKNDHNRDFRDAIRGAAEAVFRSYIEDGSITTTGKSGTEIVDEYATLIDKLIDTSELDVMEFHTSIDHRDILLERARVEAEHGHDQLAITLYSTWIEHSVNGLLALAMERQGRSKQVVTPLLRELRIPTKITALWELVGLPALREGSVRVLDQALNFRNAFVHYKWSATSDQEHRTHTERLHAIVPEIERVVSEFMDIESAAIWDGRKAEIMECYRSVLDAHEKKHGPITPEKLNLLLSRENT